MSATVDAVRLQVTCPCGYEDNEIDMSRGDLDRTVEESCEECDRPITVEVQVFVS